MTSAVQICRNEDLGATCAPFVTIGESEESWPLICNYLTTSGYIEGHQFSLLSCPSQAQLTERNWNQPANHKGHWFSPFSPQLSPVLLAFLQLRSPANTATKQADFVTQNILFPTQAQWLMFSNLSLRRSKQQMRESQPEFQSEALAQKQGLQS